MPVALRKRKKELAIAFTEEVTIYQAEAVSDELKSLLASLKADEAMPIVVDLKAVTDMDSSGVQLILALEKSLDTKGLKAERIDHGEPSRSLFELYRLLPDAA